MKISVTTTKLAAAHGMFRIARAAATHFDAAFVTIEHEGFFGMGEARPSVYYDGETVQTVVDVASQTGPLLGDDPFLLDDIMDRVSAAFPKAHASITAIDMALHDLIGKMLGVPLYKYFGLNPAKTPATSYTISIEEPAVMAQRAAAVRDFKILKIKLGLGRDVEILQAIRDVTDMPIRVDANTGWSKEQAVENLTQLAKFNIEFCEQPVPPGDNAALRFIKERSPIPIMADESSVTLQDLPGLIGCVDAVNVKLMKCGGMRQAVKMIHFARACGMKVMLGCMVETSVAITAAATLSPMVDYSDLDGNFLLEFDPYIGATNQTGRHILPNRPGPGTLPRKA